jgi:hypothetical protein
MKKKIGDMTLRKVAEYRNRVCANHSSCGDCPIIETVCDIDNRFINMDYEVEVDE